jgi:hypothetical protein
MNESDKIQWNPFECNETEQSIRKIHSWLERCSFRDIEEVSLLCSGGDRSTKLPFKLRYLQQIALSASQDDFVKYWLGFNRVGIELSEEQIEFFDMRQFI